ncbi:MAG TPA: Grx4 family monothiol glutaredoxin [Polyangiales bacterium]|nr:Grx4 family monothiol glutaredoxin [Polyangiales bacterium]
MSIDPGLRTRIQEIIDSDKVVLFMKGTRHFPQCGFSATVTQILSQLVPEYKTVNVLTDPSIREGIKAFSEWPTIPQLYVGGKFVGGCDIVRELFQSGELQGLIGGGGEKVAAKPAAPTGPAPKVSVSAAAKQAIAAAKGDESGTLRLEISPSFEHALSIDDPADDDFRVDAGGITVLVDPQSAPRANGVQIDYDESGAGFKVDNPNEGPKVRQISPAQLKAMIDEKKAFQFFDVRTPVEQQRATLGARLLDESAAQEIDALDRDTPLVFHCHHGGRSQAAAERFVQAGFREVYNLAGGIDAWSQQIDPSIPRY